MWWSPPPMSQRFKLPFLVVWRRIYFSTTDFFVVGYDSLRRCFDGFGLVVMSDLVLVVAVVTDLVLLWW
jgi:hypothetical protein